MSFLAMTWNVDLARLRKNATAASLANRIDNVGTALDRILKRSKPSIVALQEVGVNAIDTIGTVLEKNNFEVKGPNSKHIMTGFSNADWLIVTDGVNMIDDRAVCYECLSRSDSEILLYNFHCPSQQRGIKKPRKAIRKFSLERLKLLAERSGPPFPEEILCGDFNLDPFDSALQEKPNIAGVRWLEWVRIFHDPNDMSRWYYNPCWKLMAANAGILGTHYFDGESDRGPWYVFDQIMFSAGLLETGADVCEIIGREEELVTTKRKKNTPVIVPNRKRYSDHLPVLASFRIP